MDSFYELWQRVDQHNLLREIDEIISIIQEVKNIPQKGRKPSVSSFKRKDLADPGYENPWENQPDPYLDHIIEKLPSHQRHLEKPIKALSPLVRKISHSSKEPYFYLGDLEGGLTKDLQQALMYLRSQNEIDLVDDDENPLPPGTPPGATAWIVRASGEFEGDKEDLIPEPVELGKEDKYATSWSPAHLAQQRRKAKSLRGKTGPSQGKSQQFGSQLNKALSNYMRYKSQGLNINQNSLMQSAQDVLQLVQQIIKEKEFGTIDPEVFNRFLNVKGLSIENIDILLQKIRAALANLSARP